MILSLQPHSLFLSSFPSRTQLPQAISIDLCCYHLTIILANSGHQSNNVSTQLLCFAFESHLTLFAYHPVWSIGRITGLENELRVAKSQINHLEAHKKELEASQQVRIGVASQCLVSFHSFELCTVPLHLPFICSLPIHRQLSFQSLFLL